MGIKMIIIYKMMMTILMIYNKKEEELNEFKSKWKLNKEELNKEKQEKKDKVIELMNEYNYVLMKLEILNTEEAKKMKEGKKENGEKGKVDGRVINNLRNQDDEDDNKNNKYTQMINNLENEIFEARDKKQNNDEAFL